MSDPLCAPAAYQGVHVAPSGGGSQQLHHHAGSPRGPHAGLPVPLRPRVPGPAGDDAAQPARLHLLQTPPVRQRGDGGGG